MTNGSDQNCLQKKIGYHVVLFCFADDHYMITVELSPGFMSLHVTIFIFLPFLFFIALHLGFLRAPFELFNERIFLAFTAQFLFVKDDWFLHWQPDPLLFAASFCHKKNTPYLPLFLNAFFSVLHWIWHMPKEV